MNYLSLYKTNQSFKEYVDRYCYKHRITIEEAVTHIVVMAYGDVYAEMQEKGVDKERKH